MEESALFGIINALKNQITEIKRNMREQQRKEIEDIEAAHENEKYLIEQKCQEDIAGYKYIISQQKGELMRLEQVNEKRNEKIGDLQTSLNDKEAEFKQKLQELKTKAEEYNTFKESFDEKVEEIKNLNDKLIKKKEKYKKYKNENSVPLYDKGNYNKLDILKNDMNDDQKNYAIETTKNALNMFNDHYKCANYINEQFENKYGGDWLVILRPSSYGNCTYKYYDKCSIYFDIGEFRIYIAKTNRGNESICLLDKGNYYKYDILTNKMSNDQKNFAIETTRQGLNMYNDSFECAKYVSNQFQNKYGGRWCVVLNPRNFGDSYFIFYDSGYICFNMGEYSICIGKTNRGDESLRLYDKGNYNKLDILYNIMNDDQKNYAIETTRKALNMHNDHHECAKYIRGQFKNRYGGDWLVILRASHYGSTSYHFYDKCLIFFVIGELSIDIAKTKA